MVRGSKLSEVRAGIRARDGRRDSSHWTIVIDAEDTRNDTVTL
jgi:hypothetical protein